MSTLQVPGPVAAAPGRDQSPARPAGRTGSTQYATPPLAALKRVGTTHNLGKPGQIEDGAAAKQAMDAASDLEIQLTSEDAKTDLLRDLIVLPADDIVVDTLTKNQRTDYSKRAGLTDEEVTQLEPAQQIAFSVFSADWKWTSRRYATYSKAEGEAIADMPGEVFEEDPVAGAANRKISMVPSMNSSSTSLPSITVIPEQDIIASKADDLQPELLQVLDPSALKSHHVRLSRKRLPIFRYFTPEYSWESLETTMVGRDQRQRHDPNPMFFQTLPKSKQVTHLLAHVKSLSLQYEGVEPVFGCLAIVDTRNFRKLTENFYFDLNTPMMRASLGPNREKEEPATLTKKALFHITNAHEAMVLVLRLERAFQGDPEVAMDPYLKHEKLKDKDAEKHRAHIRDVADNICPKFGKYRQVFAWSFAPIFDSKGALRPPAAPAAAGAGAKSSDAVGPLFRELYPLSHKDNIIELIAELRDPKNAKKSYKTVAGSCDVTLTTVQTPPPNLLDPSLAPVKHLEHEKTVLPPTLAPMPSDLASSSSQSKDAAKEQQKSRGVSFASADKASAAEEDEVVREVQEMPGTRKDFTEPFFSYLNNLYMHPTSVNFGSEKNFKNIGIRYTFKEDDQDPEAPGLQVFYGRSGCAAKSREARGQVSYKNKTPSFTDEIKIALPPRLSLRHHILFTFYHLNVDAKKDKKKDELPPEVLIGYAVLPVYPQSKIMENGAYNLPVVLGKLEPRYLSKLTATELQTKAGLTFVDGGKPVFLVYVELLSTIYAQDPVLSAFSKVYHMKEFFQDAELAECVGQFSLIPPSVALQHLPVIIHELLTVLGTRSAQAGLTTFKALVVLLNKVQGKLVECRPARTSPLSVILDFVLDNTRTSTQPYKALSNNLLLFFMESRMAADADERKPGESVDELYPVLWFLFEAIVKSMHLRLNDPSSPSKHDIETVEPGLHRLIKRSLVAVVRAMKASLAEIHRKATTPVIDPNAKDADKQLQALLEKQQAAKGADSAAAPTPPTAAANAPRAGATGLVIPMMLDAAGAAEAQQMLSNVNRNIALFVRDLCHVMDRGHMADVIGSVVAELSDAPIKGPGAPPPLPEVKELLDTVFAWKHDLLRIVSDAEHVVPFNCPMPYSVADFAPADLSESLTRKHPIAALLVRTVLGDMKRKQRNTATAIATLNQLLCKHDYDARYQDKERRERVALLYFALVPLLVDDYASLRPWREAADEEERRSFYVCVLYLIKNAKEQLLAWAMKESPARLLIFTEIIGDCIDAFQFNPLEKKIPPHLLRQKALLDEMLAGAVQLPIDEKHKFRNAKLSAESSLVILDLLEDFIYTSRYFLNINSSALANAALTSASPLSPRGGAVSPRSPASPRVTPLSPRGPASPRAALGFASNADLVNKIFYLLVRLLKRRQSEFFLSCMYASLSTFCWKYRQLLFTNGAWCADLLREVIRHCSFATPKIRACATAFFYTFIKQCYFALGSFGRLAVQATTALSTLDNQGELAKEDRFLKRAFTTISRYALYDYGGIHVTLQDRQRSTTYLVELFARWVQGLAVTLTKTARDTIQVNEVEREKASDAELIADLYFRIAQGYTHIPDLRITWLEKLAVFHDKKEQFAEAGMCFVHIATLIWSYLSTTFPDYLDMKPYVANILNPIAPGVLQQNVDWSAQEEIGSSPHFCEKGLIAALKKAIYFLKQAEYFEYANDLYKILVPLWERSENFKELQQAHGQLGSFFTTLWTVNESRLFGKYFRVGFYGSLFGDLDGHEFVYREKGLTHLLDITERLKTTFGARFGAAAVVILADSRQVDRSTLDPSKAYLQITHLEPYLAPEDFLKRRTFFKRNTGLREFIFVTPFTLAGKAHGPINEQYKRKTILSVDTAFPALLKRLPVVSKREVVGSPIENAIEDIVARTLSIDTELQREKPNGKAVQSLLQGSVRLQVNQGAAEVARVFLGSPGNYPSEHVESLRARMGDFLQACANLLALNAKLTEESTDAREASFHEEMVNGYNSLAQEISPLINVEGPSVTVSAAPAVPNSSSAGSVATKKSIDAGTTPTKKEMKEAVAANKEAVKLLAVDDKNAKTKGRGSLRGDDK